MVCDFPFSPARQRGNLRAYEIRKEWKFILPWHRKEQRKARRADSIRSVPENVHRILADAAQLYRAGRIEDAAARYERAVSLDPRDANAHNNLGVALVQLRRIDEARVQFERALHLRPDHAHAHHNLGNVLAQAGKIGDAIPHLEYACALNPDLVDTHRSLGAACRKEGRLDEAVRHYRHVLASRPDDAETHNELGTLLKFQGSFDAASTHYGQAIAIKPSYAHPHYNRAEIKTFYPGDPDLAALERLAVKEELSADDAVLIHFALAKALEDCGEFDRAFQHLREANDLKRRQICYDEPGVEQYLRQVATVFDRRLLDRFANEGDASSAPIFVVGMPRSGSTLVEQILSTHPEIFGAGESIDFTTSLHTALSEKAQAFRFPECIPGLDGVTLRRIAQAYTTRLRARAGGDLRIVDKTPANFIYVGLIHLIFPNAKIIHTVRNPIDTCLSCYSKLFTEGQQFSYDLAELGRLYCRYAALMAHWRSVLPPGTILDVSYGEVVDDLETQARRLIDHCGLPWDDRCLRFHENHRPVSTASTAQIRRPLFRTSLDRWRRYEPHLAPLLAELRTILPEDAFAQAIPEMPAVATRARAASAR